MKPTITLTVDEAKEITNLIMPAGIDEFIRSQAIVGVIGLVEAMQKLGYRVSRPLKAVG